ncbi:hypothetical protein SEA_FIRSTPLACEPFU_76 [Mycobacterium phage FirstPlacePfu]|uniref:Uncharacterized protein n=1 Tax=Mycobacterium phage FirstPlacePfu TaxID=2572533 RepID=A0A4D6TAN6_9CAUD|nr:hypothetical protein I5J46_gp76 [Mycobacterium phage FirstPlacePfu]QCG77744.1 hypothetical protein SEA_FIRSTPLACEPFU_76 [Mycobacterium phage FirstPlacePfu]
MSAFSRRINLCNNTFGVTRDRKRALPVLT